MRLARRYATLVLAVGFSRVYLGVHWASDVAGGCLAGSPLLAGCILAAEYGRYRGRVLPWRARRSGA